MAKTDLSARTLEIRYTDIWRNQNLLKKHIFFFSCPLQTGVHFWHLEGDALKFAEETKFYFGANKKSYSIDTIKLIFKQYYVSTLEEVIS